MSATTAVMASPGTKPMKKPKLAVTTPVTASFPREALSVASASELRSAVSLPSAIAASTPLSAVSRSSAFRDPLSALPSAALSARSPYPGSGPASACLKVENKLSRTPITPPIAYMDFLKGMSLASPRLASSQSANAPLNRPSTTTSVTSRASTSTNNSLTISAVLSSDDSDEKDKSEPSTASSEQTDISCSCHNQHSCDDNSKRKSSRPADIKTRALKSTYNVPMSAPATSAIAFPSMKVPASPAACITGVGSPVIKSPFSAAPSTSAFDWDTALKLRRYSEAKGTAEAALASKPPVATTPTTVVGVKREASSLTLGSTSTVHRIREVVTRTVTYKNTPRMAPAPKGKRRKVDQDMAVET